MKMNWSVSEETIKTVKCLYCDQTGNTKWAEKHLKEKKYYKLPMSELKNQRGIQFVVIEKV